MGKLVETKPRAAPTRTDSDAGARAPETKVKSIVLFSDGTGNSSAKLFKTNVFRLYEAVDLGPPSAGKQRQIAYYDNGVGTSAFRPLRMLQGVFGFGLKRNVLEIYRYACRNYDPDSLPVEGSDIPEKGDHIYGFGFSRGAFTMRLVIGLIADQGLIPYKDEKDLQRKARAAWKQFRRTSRRRVFQSIAGWFRTREPQSEGEAAAAGLSPDAGRRGRNGRRAFNPAENHRPIIRFIGVWDTVAAYGGPIAEVTRAIDNWIYPLSMPNYALHPRVRRARHALALDDERESFWPLLWDEVAERQMIGGEVDGEAAPWLDSDRLQQVWFAGMHGDIGGGYPDESLSYVSLLWIVEEANRCRLRTVDSITERYRSLANSFGPIHDSRAGLGSYYRFQPRKLAAFMAAGADSHIVGSTLSLRDPAVGAGREEKGLLETVVVHESVVARIATGTDGYAPIVLPEFYEVIPPGGLSETAVLETTGDDLSGQDDARPRTELQPQRSQAAPAEDGGAGHAQPEPAPPQALWRRIGRRLISLVGIGWGSGTPAEPPQPEPLLPPHIRGWLNPKAMKAIAVAMERPWDFVWRRRVAYFLNVLVTVALVTMPWSVPRAGSGSATAEFQLMWDGRNSIGNLIRIPGKLLPDFLQRWIETWATHSFLFALLIAALYLLRWFSRRQERRTRDRAREIWHGRVPRIPPASARSRPSGLGAHYPSRLERFRNRRSYQRAIQLFKWNLLPNFAIAPIMVVLISLLVLGVGTQAALPWLERTELLCSRSGQEAYIEAVRVDFATRRLCNPARGRVRAEERYLITFDVVDDWADGTYPTTPQGLNAGDMRWLAGYAGVPLRRVIDARYLEPLVAVRTGDGGILSHLTESVPIRRLELQPVEGEPNRYQAEYTAPARGELFLFANDAVFPFRPAWFYSSGLGGNRGTACVTIQRVTTPAPDVPPPASPLCRQAAGKPVAAAPAQRLGADAPAAAPLRR